MTITTTPEPTDTHWQRITALRPRIEAAAYRRYPHSVPEFMDAATDSLLALPLCEIDPASASSHTDSYLVSRAVFAGRRTLWHQLWRSPARNEYAFADLTQPTAEMDDWLEICQMQSPWFDESHLPDDDDPLTSLEYWPMPHPPPSPLAQALAEIKSRLAPEEQLAFHILEDALFSGSGVAGLFHSNGRINQAAAASRYGVAKSTFNRWFVALRDQLEPLLDSRVYLATEAV